MSPTIPVVSAMPAVRRHDRHHLRALTVVLLATLTIAAELTAQAEPAEAAITHTRNWRIYTISSPTVILDFTMLWRISDDGTNIWWGQSRACGDATYADNIRGFLTAPSPMGGYGWQGAPFQCPPLPLVENEDITRPRTAWPAWHQYWDGGPIGSPSAVCHYWIDLRTGNPYAASDNAGWCHLVRL